MDLKHFTSTDQVVEFAFEEAIASMQRRVRAKVEDKTLGDHEYHEIQARLADLWTVAHGMSLFR